MCGIFGVITNNSNNVKDQIFDGLRRLEYRGYDSSGIATINNNQINCVKSQGNLDQLQKKLINEELIGNVGIGHTRWATHGVPNESNAHPHFTDEVAVVHNGIIENYSLLKNQIVEAGISFKSETDTEAIAHLITLYLKSGMGSYEAIRATTEDIKGSYALAIIMRSEPNKLYAVRKGSPLAVGTSENENYIGSDGYSLGNYCKEVTYLKDGDIAIIDNSSFEIFDNQNEFIKRKSQIIDKTYISRKRCL
jgi:glucosamine--fructose-6-phosphate aminotransferase (isomerizing)